MPLLEMFSLNMQAVVAYPCFPLNILAPINPSQMNVRHQIHKRSEFTAELSPRTSDLLHNTTTTTSPSPGSQAGSARLNK